MRYLSIDPGDKRTGFAVGDDETFIVTPLDVVAASSPDAQLDAVAKAIDAQGPNAIVVGLPLHMDGTESGQSKKARHLAAAIGERFDLPVHLVDERLSSFAAEEAMAGRDLTRGQKKQQRDAHAAAVILKDFLDNMKSEE